MKCLLSLLLLASIVCLAQTYREDKKVSVTYGVETAGNIGINGNSGRMFLKKFPNFRSMVLGNDEPSPSGDTSGGDGTSGVTPTATGSSASVVE